MTRAFILDPSQGSSNAAAALIELARRDFGWSVDQLSFEETQTGAPAPAIARLRTACEEAEVFICLGSFFVFDWLGDGLGDRLVEVVCHRLKQGTPALFQMPRFFERLRNGQIAKRTEAIFRQSEVLSTDNRVVSESDAYLGHSSPMTSYFRKVDGCLLNAELFRGIDSILISLANLLDYSGEVFPIVEAGHLHSFVDGNDLRSEGI